MSSLPGWKEISCFAAVTAGRFLCNQIAEMSTILYVCIQHGLGYALQSRVREGCGVSFGLITSLPLPTEQANRLAGLGLHLVLKAQFPILTNYVAKVDLSVLSQMVFSDLE